MYEFRYAKEHAKNLTAVTGTDGRFAIADLRLGPNRVSMQLPVRGPTGQVAMNITGVTIMLTVSDQNVSLVVDSRELRVGD
jgi:hypothetical protein